MRKKLPNRRHQVTTKVKVEGITLHICVGFYGDDRPGELFLDASKQGSAVRHWSHATARLVSLLLQHDVPALEIAKALRHSNSEMIEAVADALTEFGGGR